MAVPQQLLSQCNYECHGTTPTRSCFFSAEAIEVDRRVLRHRLRELARARVVTSTPGAEVSGVAGIRGLRPHPDGQGHLPVRLRETLGQSLFELRIDHDVGELAQVFGADLSAHPELIELVAEGILLRAFCTFYDDKIVLRLSGLDKGAGPKAQPRAIRAARKLLADWQAEQAAAKRSRKRRPTAAVLVY